MSRGKTLSFSEIYQKLYFECSELMLVVPFDWFSSHVHAASKNATHSTGLTLNCGMYRLCCSWWHDATINNIARTNICEERNDKFFNLIGHYHPTVGRFIKYFQRERSYSEQHYPTGCCWHPTASKKCSLMLYAAARMASRLVCCSTGALQAWSRVLSWLQQECSSSSALEYGYK